MSILSRDAKYTATHRRQQQHQRLGGGSAQFEALSIPF
jgi:hypothetical protein